MSANPATVDLVRYDAMCFAIAECHRVDEVKDLRDKAMALELYAKQARNTDAERRASEIRLRAERRTGELLKALARGEAGRPLETIVPTVGTIVSPFAEALSRTGISTQAASRFQALANIPTEVFEEALRDSDVKPSGRRMIDLRRSVETKMPEDSLWLWGRMRDFEREAFANKDPGALLSAMTETMRADVARIAPLMADFFNDIVEASK